MIKIEELPLLSSIIEIWFGIYLLNRSPSRLVEIAFLMSYVNSLFVFFLGYLYNFKINFYPVRLIIWSLYFMSAFLELFQVSYEFPS